MDDDEKLTSKKERCKVIETEDASRGPLSGCIRLADSSRVIQRLKVTIKKKNIFHLSCSNKVENNLSSPVQHLSLTGREIMSAVQKLREKW